MKRMFNNGRYANVAATLALVLAMGGTSYAAYTLPHNSVGSNQIKPWSVKNSDIGGSAITSAKVMNHSLRSYDFAPGSLPAGPQGNPGPQGPSGQATAYANIMFDGSLNPGNPWPHRGFAFGDIQHNAMTGTGIYCIGGMDFTPKAAMVTVQGAPSAVPIVASVNVNHGSSPLAKCDASHQQARVTLTEVDPAKASAAPIDQGFYVWIEK